MRKEILAAVAAASLASFAAPALAQHAHAPAKASSARAFLASGTSAARKGATVVTIRTMDYAFGIPDTIAAGAVTFRIENAGKELHHAQIVKLEQGKTAADYLGAMKTMKPGQPYPSWAVDVGGPNASVPGALAEATLTLEAGNYLMICFIPSPDGVPHVAKGMFKPFAVAARGGAAQAGEPQADVTVTLADYDFVTSKPLTAGRRTLRFENAAAQPHEAFIAKLAPGKTLADALGFLEKMQGQPPIVPMGGVTGFVKGRAVSFTADFEPGEYVLVCFVPDAKDGKPHLAHGMAKTISVK